MTEKKPTKRKLQAQATRKKIYNAAMDLITEKGYDNITVAEICEHAGVAKGLFYYYFNSKNDFIIETYKNIDELYRDTVVAGFRDDSTWNKILKTVSFQARYGIKVGLGQTIEVYKSQLVSGTEYFVSESRYFFQVMRDYISEGQQKGEIRTDIEADEIVRTILSFSRGIVYDWCLHKGSYDIDTVMQQRFIMIMNCFAPLA